MAAHPELAERRTSADIVFDTLQQEISSLALLPGTKLSEAEIAKRFGVSRQPIRDAFARLSNLGLLVIRPQRATMVRHFSREQIANARFIRAAVEVEVLRQACGRWTGHMDEALSQSMERQRAAAAANDPETFHTLDYDFHRLLCEAAGAAFAFETIATNKAQVDRLCILSLTSRAGMEELVDDHAALLAGLRAGDEVAVERTIRLHLSRLDPTIQKIYDSHNDYFTD